MIIFFIQPKHFFSLFFALMCAVHFPSVAQAVTTSVDLRQLNSKEVTALLTGKYGAYMLVANPGMLVMDHGHVDIVGLDARQRPNSRTPTALSCVRLSLAQNISKPDEAKIFCFSNKKTGLRLDDYSLPVELVFSNKIVLLRTSETQKVLGRQPIINRARISSDGKYTATTVFTFGSGYTTTGGGFSTETRISKTDDISPSENIEKWRVTVNDIQITAQDLNIWGVTFDPANSDQFLVTVSTGGKPRLARGSISRREIKIINNTSDIECPSFSPDGKKVAFKRKKLTPNQWSPAILDIATGVETIFEVDRNVDDQIEWLNNHTLVYEVRTPIPFGAIPISLMTLDVRSSKNKHQLFLENARSPTFFRP